MHGCDSGLAVAIGPVRAAVDEHRRAFAFTMYLVREHGKWTVAADNVHLVSS